MRSDKKLNINRQELRRDARRAPIERCPICGKSSTRHNLKLHALVAEKLKKG